MTAQPWEEPCPLPLSRGWSVDPAAVVLSVRKHGRPHPKERPRSGGTRFYTPRQTQEAEDEWRWCLRVLMRGRPPERGRLALAAEFRLPDARICDADNLIKLVLDAGTGIAWQNDQLVEEEHLFVRRRSPEAGTDILLWRLD